MNIIDQLYLIYLNEHPWITNKLPKYEIDAYHRILLSRGNIITETDEGKLLGYIEVLKITPEQLGRIILDRGFSSTEEDSLYGDVGIVFNVWIDKDFRNTWVIKNLEKKFYEFTKECKEFCGIALRKRHQPVKVFKRDKLKDFIQNKVGVEWVLKN